jgi:acyl carrier protein
MSNQSRSDLSERIIEFIRAELRDKTTEITRDTPIESIHIDSLDVIEVLYKFEDEFNVSINLSPNSKFLTVGEFIDSVLDQVPGLTKVSA